MALENLGTDIYIFRLQRHLTLLQTRLGKLFEFVERILTILRFVTACLWLATHPFQLAAVEVVGMLYARHHRVDALLALFQVVGIRSAIGVDGLVFEFKDYGAHIVEEEPVVCHHEDGLVAARKEILQPDDHLEVEVVCGLVEYQEIGIGYQHLRQCHTFLLSAGELVYGLLHVGDT